MVRFQLSAARVRGSAFVLFMVFDSGAAACSGGIDDDQPAGHGHRHRRAPTEAGPLPGLTISQDQIPANIQSASRKDIRDSNALNLGDYMARSCRASAPATTPAIRSRWT
ncbi:MAG: hypothetical protein WDO12_01405 [Pseudomonadota bacterium]